jgi:hypothetical protein
MHSPGGGQVIEGQALNKGGVDPKIRWTLSAEVLTSKLAGPFHPLATMICPHPSGGKMPGPVYRIPLDHGRQWS